jgi:hypothetical protein
LDKLTFESRQMEDVAGPQVQGEVIKKLWSDTGEILSIKINPSNSLNAPYKNTAPVTGAVTGAG